MQTKRQAYANQKRNASQRGITWNFTLSEWIEWWGDDFALRSNKSDGLVMARINDTGPYEPDNVLKLSQQLNKMDRQIAPSRASGYHHLMPYLVKNTPKV